MKITWPSKMRYLGRPIQLEFYGYTVLEKYYKSLYWKPHSPKDWYIGYTKDKVWMLPNEWATKKGMKVYNPMDIPGNEAKIFNIRSIIYLDREGEKRYHRFHGRKMYLWDDGSCLILHKVGCEGWL